MIIEASAYPTDKKQSNINRFHAQFMAWHWYCEQAMNRSNKYLLNHSVNKLILFAGRLILTHNEILYPYHKWFLHELNKAKDKPENMMDLIDDMLENPSIENINIFF